MKNRTVQLTGRWVSLLAFFLLGSCDPFEEDFIRKENQLIINASARDYYILANTPTVIDLKAMVTRLFASVTVRISEHPTRGTLTSLKESLLMYSPSPAFIEGNDKFKVVFTSDENVLTETITIHMTEDASGFPCSLYAVEDNAHSTSGRPVSIRILFNDRICGIKAEDVHVSISVGPKHGQAIVQGDSIIYTSETDYEGPDEIIYEIRSDEAQQTSGSNNQVFSHGLVKIYVSDAACPFFLLDSYTLDLSDEVDDLPNTGECSGGYDIPIWGILTPPCNNYGIYIHEISQSNKSGSVCFGKDGGFAYYPDPAKAPADDTANFEVCVNGQCTDVNIIIIRTKPG